MNDDSVMVDDKDVQQKALAYRRPSMKEMRKRIDNLRCGAALDFLEQLRPKGPWVLTTIIPDGITATFTCKTDDEAADVIYAYNGLRNIYYSVNPTRTAMTKKAAKKDIAAAEFIHADLDPRDDETSDEAKARYLKLLTVFKPQPTMIVDSGNGLNCLWRLDQSVPPRGPGLHFTGVPEVHSGRPRCRPFICRLCAGAGFVIGCQIFVHGGHAALK